MNNKSLYREIIRRMEKIENRKKIDYFEYQIEYFKHQYLRTDREKTITKELMIETFNKLKRLKRV